MSAPAVRAVPAAAWATARCRAAAPRPGRWARRGGLASLAIAGVLAGAVSVDAHAMLVRSVPASRATVRQPPTRVELWFSERLEPAFSTASVLSGAGTRVDRQDAGVAGDDARRLALTLSAIEPGRYTVRYRVLSLDGHVAEGSFSFVVSGGAR